MSFDIIEFNFIGDLFHKNLVNQMNVKQQTGIVSYVRINTHNHILVKWNSNCTRVLS